MSAVLGIDQPIGIPEYEQAKMFAIIERALTADEVELLRRGYGFGQKRQSQKEISTDMGIDYRDVSRRAHTAIKKLQASPYKNQLKALIPTVDDLLATISELKNANFRLQQDIEVIRAVLKKGTVPSVMKRSVELLGIPVGPARLPVLELEPQVDEEIKEMLKFYGLMS